MIRKASVAAGAISFLEGHPSLTFSPTPDLPVTYEIAYELGNLRHCGNGIEDFKDCHLHGKEHQSDDKDQNKHGELLSRFEGSAARADLAGTP